MVENQKQVRSKFRISKGRHFWSPLHKIELVSTLNFERPNKYFLRYESQNWSKTRMGRIIQIKIKMCNWSSKGRTILNHRTPKGPNYRNGGFRSTQLVSELVFLDGKIKSRSRSKYRISKSRNFWRLSSMYEIKLSLKL